MSVMYKNGVLGPMVSVVPLSVHGVWVVSMVHVNGTKVPMVSVVPHSVHGVR